MRGLTFLVWLVLAFVLTGDARAKEAVPFVFRVPAGWKAGDATMAAAQASGVLNANGVAMVGTTPAVTAINPASDPEFAENMNAVVRDGARPITRRLVREAADEALRGFQTMQGGPGATIIESRIMSIRGVDCGNVTFDYTMRGTPVRTTSYLLPGNKHTAIVTFVARRDDFERHRTLYEDTIAATEGIVRPPDTSFIALFGAPIAGMIIGTAIRQLLRRRSAKRKPAAS